MLVGAALDVLGTAYPLITTPEEINDSFEGIFKYFNFKLEGVYNNYYREGIREFSYNGLLRPSYETPWKKETETMQLMGI